MLALSIVAPHDRNIASGLKTLEVCSWHPPSLPLRNLLVVENTQLLSSECPEDPQGVAVAIVDVEQIHEWLPTEVAAACSTGWQPGYWAWTLSNIRPVAPVLNIPAKRKLYEIDMEEVLFRRNSAS